MSRGPVTGKSDAFGKIGTFGLLWVVFAFIWQAIYTTALGNGVGTNGLGSASLGEIIFLLAGIPIFLSVYKRGGFSFLAMAFGAIGVVLLALGQVGLNLACNGAVQCIGLPAGKLGFSVSSYATNLVYVTSPLALVVTLGSFSISEESGFGAFIRGSLDSILHVENPIAGFGVSLLIYGPFFALFHTFVTIAAISALLNVPSTFGAFNLGVLFTPFGLSAILARAILDTLIRVTGWYEAAFIAHAGFDMTITAHMVGLI